MSSPSSSRAWSRRRFLTGLSLGAGALVLGPLRRRLEAEARDLPISPRVVFLVEGCGGASFPRLPVEQTKGRSEEVVTSRSFPLGRALRSLEPLRDRLLLVDGLANLQGAGVGGNHSGEHLALSCRPLDHGPGGITIDRHLAARLGGDSPISALHLGVVGDPTTTLSSSLSADGPRQPVPLQCDPRQAFREVFGSVLDGQGAAAREEQALLDHLTQDVRRVRGELAGIERRKLDQYLAALDELTRRRGLLAGSPGLVACAPKGEPPLGTYVERLHAQVDLAAAALLCGLTRVVVLGAGCGYPHYADPVSGLGLTLDKHALAHGQRDPSGLTIEDVNDVHAAAIVRLALALQRLPEGDGTAFDHTVIVYLNDNGDEHHARYLRWPAVLVGDAGGRLRSDGRHVRFPGRGLDRSRSLAELWNSLGHALGAPVDDFGRGGNEPSRGPIPELMV